MTTPDAPDLGRRHVTFGLLALASFMLGGLALEGLLGFKAPLYVDVDAEMRRELWRLAHAHGTLLAVVNIGYGLIPAGRRTLLGSRMLLVGSILIPLGFLAGGANPHGGDPGLGIILVPIGALLAIASVARAGLRSDVAP